jgi:hypothetical protein
MLRFSMKKVLGTVLAIMAATILIGTLTSDPILAGEKARDGRFVAYDNGTVVDTRTNLMWAAKDNGADIDWSGAKSYCDNYRGGDYTDWRMPTWGELADLYDDGKSYTTRFKKRLFFDSGYTVHLTELIQLSAPYCWASGTRNSEAPGFYFSFEKHYAPLVGGGSGDLRALPVRSGK